MKYNYGRLINIQARRDNCPQCGRDCPAHSQRIKKVWDFSGQVQISYTVYHCKEHGFFQDRLKSFPFKAKYSIPVKERARELRRNGCTLREISEQMTKEVGKHVGETTVYDWVRDE